MHDFEQKKRQILERVDLLQLVSEHVRLKRNGRRWVGLCCFHTEKTPSFSVNPDLGIFKCFGCGKGGDAFTFVQERENMPFMDAFRLLADRAGVDISSHSGSRNPNEVSRNDLAKVNEWAVGYFRENLQHESRGRHAREYVANRQVSKASVEKFELGLAFDGPDSHLIPAASRAGFSTALLVAADLARTADDGRTYETFRNRLIFPIRDATNRVIGFGGRTLGDHQAKYLNTRQTALFDKGRSLYALNLAREALNRTGRAILVEGYMDCLAAHQSGFPETMASLGTALTESQVEILRRYADRFILLFDSDSAGEAASERAIQLVLPKGIQVRLARIPDAKDPADFLSRHGPEAFEDVLNKAVDALEFKWNQTWARFETEGSNAKRGEAVAEFVRMVAAACETGAVDVIQRGLLVNQVAHLVKLDQAEVMAMFRHCKADGSASSGERPEPRHAREVDGPRSEEQAAWNHWFGAVLCEPGLLATVEPLPNIERIANTRDRRLAGLILELAIEVGEFRLTDLLAKCEDPLDVRRVAELAEAGTQRGNPEATFRLAMERLNRIEESLRVDSSVQRLRQAPSEGMDRAEAAEHLTVVSNGMKNRRHFAPRRMVRQVLSNGAVDGAPKRQP